MWRGWLLCGLAACSGGGHAAPDAVVTHDAPADAAPPDGLACVKPQLYVAATGTTVTRVNQEDAIANTTFLLTAPSATFDPIDPTYAASILARAHQSLDPYARVVEQRPLGVVPYNMIVLVTSAQFAAAFANAPPGAGVLAICGPEVNRIAFVQIFNNVALDSQDIAAAAGFASGLNWATGSAIDCMSLNNTGGTGPCTFSNGLPQSQTVGCPSGPTQDEVTSMEAMYKCP